MCTLILAHRLFPEASLIAFANRDELLARPARPPALMRGEPSVLAPKDEVAGGTWLGLNAHGLFVGITNRFGPPVDNSKRSRGLLTREALQASSAHALHARLKKLDANSHNPFHLLYSDGDEAFVTWMDGHSLRQEALKPGFHVVTERSLGGDDGGRSERIIQEKESRALNAHSGPMEWAKLLALHGSAEAPQSGTCVHLDSLGYGTRSSFIYKSGKSPWAYSAEGHPCERRQWVNHSAEIQELFDEG